MRLDPAARTRSRSRPELTGERVEHVDRRGKYLIVRFASGRALLIHLRMTGTLAPRSARRRRTSARCVGLDDGSSSATATCAASARGSCSSRASSSRTSAPVSARSRSSPPSRRRVSASGWRVGARRSRRRCSTSGRSPGSGTSTSTRRSGTRGSTRCGRRARSTATSSAACTGRSARALELGIARQGSTLTDYRLPDGSSGSMQNEFKAYGRDGRAVRPLRHAAREDARRGSRHLVLPELPAALRACVETTQALLVAAQPCGSAEALCFRNTRLRVRGTGYVAPSP